MHNFGFLARTHCITSVPFRASPAGNRGKQLFQPLADQWMIVSYDDSYHAMLLTQSNLGIQPRSE